MSKEKFFRNLPNNTIKGICEPLEGSSSNGSIVKIYNTCVTCPAGECMTFKPVFRRKYLLFGKREIVGRKFKFNPSEVRPISSQAK